MAVWFKLGCILLDNYLIINFILLLSIIRLGVNKRQLYFQTEVLI